MGIGVRGGPTSSGTSFQWLVGACADVRAGVRVGRGVADGRGERGGNASIDDRVAVVDLYVDLAAPLRAIQEY